MNYYYADSSNQPIGPISIEQLHALSRDGTIGMETFILPEGSEDWQQYRSISPALPPPTKSLVPIIRNAPTVLIVPHVGSPISETKTCAFCAEPIAAAAKKCKHCGETLDVALRAAEEAKRMSQRQPNVYMNAGGAAIASPGVQKRSFPHLLHFVVTCVTFGLWLPIWILHYLTRDRNYYW